MFQPRLMLFRKRISAPGRSGNSKRYRISFSRRRRVAADQMAHVQLGHFVVGQVVRLDPPRVHRAQQRRGLVPVGDLDADENVRDARIGVAIVEFGDAALAQQRAELAEAARPLGNRHREDRLARFAELGPFGDEAQAVEIHVGAAGDRDESAALRRGAARTRP